MWLTLVVVCLAVSLIRSGDAANVIDEGANIETFGENDRFIYSQSNYLGGGTFGQVYLGHDQKTDHQVAVKIETPDVTKKRYATIPTEKKVYDILGTQRGIPHFFYSGRMGIHKYVMVTQLLENSLDNLQHNLKGRFSLKTCCMLGIQMMYRFEYIHSKRLVHRDIKPGNMGIGSSGKMLYIFDFGLSEKYVDAYGMHVAEGPIRPNGSGTPYFMSIYAHSHNTQSRRDDMESIGYVLLYMLTGTVPWRKMETQAEMAQMKMNLDYKKAFKGFPEQFVDYFKYVRGLRFEERPKYPWLRQLFRDVLLGMSEKEDFMFDWVKK